MMETGTADTILYSGSFNPIHRGHLAVANRYCRLFPAVSCGWWFRRKIR